MIRSAESASMPLAPFGGFSHVVCAVDGSRASEEAVRQAARCVAPGGDLALVAVSDARGTGAMAQASLGERRAATAIDQACEIAAAAGTAATGRVVMRDDIAGSLLDAAADSDLIVVGGRPHARAAGILLGSTGSRILHAGDVPVLVARARPELAFPGVVLVGSRGEQDDDAVAAGAWIARHTDARVVLAHAGPSSRATRHGLARQAAGLLELTGHDPVVLAVDGNPVERLPATAQSTGAGLLVLGSRGLTGVGALASVSERVAHRSPCSVLVLRGAAKYRSTP